MRVDIQFVIFLQNESLWLTYPGVFQADSRIFAEAQGFPFPGKAVIHAPKVIVRFICIQ